MLFNSNRDRLPRSVHCNNIDFAAAFALGADIAGLAYCCDLLVAADIPKLRRVSGRYEFLALFQLFDFCLDFVCLALLQCDA